MRGNDSPVSDFAKAVYTNLSVLPFCSTAELSRLRGFGPESKVANAMRELKAKGYATSTRHHTEHGARGPTVRYFVGARGITDFAGVYKTTPEIILEKLPVSSDWQREMLKRIDSLAMIYGLCVKIAELRPSTVPLTIIFPRHSDFDAFITTADDLCIGVIRKGRMQARLEFRSRFWAVTNGSGPDNSQRRGPPLSLVVVPTAFEKRWYAEMILDEFRQSMRCAVATEYEAAQMPPDSAPWILCDRTPRNISLKEMVHSLEPDPGYHPLARVDFKRVTPPRDSAKLREFVLTPVQKRIVDVVADWPLISKKDIGRILGLGPKIVGGGSVGKHFKDLIEQGYIRIEGAGWNKRYLIGDRGLRYLAYRDRTSLGMMRKAWGVEGSRLTKVLKEREHSEKITEIVARIFEDHPGRIESLPDHATTRRFKPSGRRKGQRQVHPDAALFLRLGGDTQSLLVEYEQRASQGGKALRAKIDVWIRYYVSGDPQFAGNVSKAENPFNLDDEVTLFVVTDENTRIRMLRRGQDLLKSVNWRKGPNGSIPIAITTEEKFMSAAAVLTDRIWLRMDDFSLRETNPVLSERRRATPRKGRRS